MTNPLQSFVLHSPSVEEMFLEDFLVILNASEIFKKCFLCNTCMVISLAWWHFQPHKNVLPCSEKAKSWEYDIRLDCIRLCLVNCRFYCNNWNIWCGLIDEVLVIVGSMIVGFTEICETTDKQDSGIRPLPSPPGQIMLQVHVMHPY